MDYSIETAVLNESNIKSVLELSKQWEGECLTFGYCANSEDDIKGNDLFLANIDGEIVGYLFGKCKTLDEMITPLDKGVKCFEIDEIYVKKQYRSLGIGKALFNYAENYCKNTVDYITLSTATKNYKSILHFYIDELDMTFWSANLFKKIK
ncbi:MAG: GNAT family N-acetyltransferase [Eubacterium sp.]